MDIKEILLSLCIKLRTSKMPISDIIPFLQRAVDRIRELEFENSELKNPKSKKIPTLLKPSSYYFDPVDKEFKKDNRYDL